MRYIENWRATNPSGLTTKSIAPRQSGANYFAYKAEHKKACSVMHTSKGGIDRRYHHVVVKWRGRGNPFTGYLNGRERYK